MKYIFVLLMFCLSFAKERVAVLETLGQGEGLELSQVELSVITEEFR